MRHIFSAIMMLGLAAEGLAQQCPSPSPIFQVGEELRYAVRWNFIRLGTITITTTRPTDSCESEMVRVVIHVESNPSIPVVSLTEYNDAIMDPVRMRSLRYFAKHDLNGHRETLRHTFQPEERSATTEFMDEEDGVPVVKVLRDVDWYVEGVTLFFYARDAARRGGRHSVPTLVSQSIAETAMEIAPLPEEIELEAVDYPVRSRKLTGTAEWTGSAAGVTGNFVGWVSDDEASVMLCAELEIFLGTIDIELERWRREGWHPPSPVTAAR